MRLCNIAQLNVCNEFGAELINYIPYYYYLYLNGLLFDNKITTYVGMKDFYYFVKEGNIIEKNEKRKWKGKHQRALLVNKSEYVKNFNTNFWIPPPYKDHFKNDIFIFKKPLLIIYNKFNNEFKLKKPINYIDIVTLETIFKLLIPKYQIVYIRPNNETTLINKQFSLDGNKLQTNLNDFQLIENINKIDDSIITFDDLLLKHNDLSYNKLKLLLYANCDNFICVQGGNAHFTTYFSKKMVLLHKHGPELFYGCYDGWYKTNSIVKVATTDCVFVNEIEKTFI